MRKTFLLATNDGYSSKWLEASSEDSWKWLLVLKSSQLWKSSWEDYTAIHSLVHCNSGRWHVLTRRLGKTRQWSQTLVILFIFLSIPTLNIHSKVNLSNRSDLQVFLFQIPAGGEVEEEVKQRVPDLDCGEEELLTHLLNIYGDQEEDEKVEDADSDDESEAGPESDEDDDRIEDFVEEENCALQATDDTKECPD